MRTSSRFLSLLSRRCAKKAVWIRFTFRVFSKNSPETSFDPFINFRDSLWKKNFLKCELGVNRTSCTATMRALHHSRNVTCLDAGHYYTSLKVLFETNLPLFANLKMHKENGTKKKEKAQSIALSSNRKKRYTSTLSAIHNLQNLTKILSLRN